MNYKIELNLKELIKNEKNRLLQCESNSDEFEYRWFLLNRLYEANNLQKENKNMVEFIIKKELFKEYLDSLD
ncbi:MAG: hypothetical protein ACRC7N_01280 [Clostridium sp.]